MTNSRPTFLLKIVALVAALMFCHPSHAITLENETASFSSLTGETVTMTSHSQLYLTASSNPIPGTTVHLNSEDAWVILPNITPSTTLNDLLPRFRVNGVNAVNGSNVRVTNYATGSIVVAQPDNFQPLEVFTERHLSGSSRKLGSYTAYGPRNLGTFNNGIRSFRLKRGYTATFATNENGTGTSINYVAQDGDLEVSIMPGALDRSVSFIRIFPWRWVSKKGSCDVEAFKLNAQWHYNWNISLNSSTDTEYVAIRQQPNWPSLNQDWKSRGINHLLGYNEPDNPVEDSYKNLSPQGSVNNAVARLPELLGTGLRLGTPAVTDGGSGWILDFVNKANAAGHRLDYVAIHYYRSYWNKDDPTGAANQMYNFLKGIHDATGKPIWVTEFNNGANWTDNNHDPNVTQNRNVIEAMINMMDNTPWIERYAIYSNVEWFRKTHYDDGSLTPMGQMYRNHRAPMAHRQVIPDTGLSPNATYTFDNHTRDSQSGNNPIVYGTPKFVEGKHGKAVALDGQNDYLALPKRLGDSDNFSFTGWIKWDGGDNWQRIFDLGNGTPSYMFLCPKTGDDLRFSMRLNNGAEQRLNAPALTPGVWTHVAITINGNTGKLFVNGQLADTNTSMTIKPSQINTQTNFIGKSQFSADPLFRGSLDSVQFHTRALSDAEVTAIATADAAQFVSSLGLDDATVDLPFSGSLDSQLTSTDSAFRFTKLSGSPWLTLAADGSFFGVPKFADLREHSMLVRIDTPAGLSTYANIPVAVKAPELVARYAFNNNPKATAGIVDATTSGNPGYTTGYKQYAINLNGTNQYLTLPEGVASSDDITIATWIRWMGGSNWQRIFDFGNDTSSYLFLSPKSSANKMRFGIKFDGKEDTLETDPLATGVWTHVAVTIGSGTIKLYVNGTLASTNTNASIKPSDIQPRVNYIGRSHYTADPDLNAQLDEFHIFSRELSSTEISTLMSAETPSVPAVAITLPQVAADSSFTHSIAHLASSPHDVSWSKLDGPPWLAISENGQIWGSPGIGDSGTWTFRVQARAQGVLISDLALKLEVTPPPSLIHHLEFQNNVKNSVSTSHGIPYGSPVYTDGLFDRALVFDGNDDYIQLPSALLTSVQDCTFSIRFRWDDGNPWQRLFDFGNNTTEWLVATPNSGDGTMRFAITNTGNTNQQQLNAPRPNPGEWTHLAIVLEGNTGTMYVNGVNTASGSITLSPADINPTTNYLGKSQWPDPLFKGAIDDLQIFNTALDATTVRSLAIPNEAGDPPHTGYELWASGFPFEAGQDGPEADPDQDGLSNLIEWILGTDPLAPNNMGSLITHEVFSAPEIGLSGEDDYLGISIRVRKDRPGVTLIPEAAATLEDLNLPQARTQVLPSGLVVDDGDFEILSWYYEIPMSAAPKGFIRLCVELEDL